MFFSFFFFFVILFCFLVTDDVKPISILHVFLELQYVTGIYKYEIFTDHKERITLLLPIPIIIIIYEWNGFLFIVLDLHTIKWEWAPIAANCKRKCLILLYWTQF